MEIACIIHEQISHFFVPKNKFLLAHFVPQINSVIMQPNPLENWTQNLTPQFTKKFIFKQAVTWYTVDTYQVIFQTNIYF